MKRSRLHDSSVDIRDVNRLYAPSLSSSSEVCTQDHPDLAGLERSGLPRVRVYMTRLEPRVKLYEDAELNDTLATSPEMAECLIAEGYPNSLSEAILFDASSVGQVMCLGIGRFPHNQLRPFLGRDPGRYYADPDAKDPQAICGQVSRDHGLVFLDPTGTLRYRDFGTRKQGVRQGSKNGTWVNGVERVQGQVITWKTQDYLGLGGRVWIQRPQGPQREHLFKLRYERILIPPEGGQAQNN